VELHLTHHEVVMADLALLLFAMLELNVVQAVQ
jgi:hypothetical protein